MQNSNSDQSKPWWHFGHVWLVISGPAIVVVAGFITLYLAITSPNEIVMDYYSQGKTADESGSARTMDSSTAPAGLGRNHAATGVVPLPKQAVDKP